MSYQFDILKIYCIIDNQEKGENMTDQEFNDILNIIPMIPEEAQKYIKTVIKNKDIINTNVQEMLHIIEILLEEFDEHHEYPTALQYLNVLKEKYNIQNSINKKQEKRPHLIISTI